MAASEPILIASHVVVDYEVRVQRRTENDGGNVLAQIMGHNTTVHAVKDVSFEQNCERVLWLEQGVLRADGPTADIMEQYREYQQLAKKSK